MTNALLFYESWLQGAYLAPDRTMLVTEYMEVGRRECPGSNLSLRNAAEACTSTSTFNQLLQNVNTSVGLRELHKCFWDQNLQAPWLA
jgi:hypothetical protein